MVRTPCSLLVLCAAIVQPTIAENASLELSSTASATLQTLDTDGSGSVEQGEIVEFAKSVGLDADEAVKDFQALDKNGNGALELSELTGSLFDFGALSQEAEPKTPDTASLSADLVSAASAAQSTAALLALPSEVDSKPEPEAVSWLSTAASAPAAPAAQATPLQVPSSQVKSEPAPVALDLAAPAAQNKDELHTLLSQVASSSEPVASAATPTEHVPPKKISLMSVSSSSATNAAKTPSFLGWLPFQVASSTPSFQPFSSAPAAPIAPLAPVAPVVPVAPVAPVAPAAAAQPKPAAMQSAMAAGPLAPQALSGALLETLNSPAAKAPASELSMPALNPRQVDAGVVRKALPQWSGAASQPQLTSPLAQTPVLASMQASAQDVEDSDTAPDTGSQVADASARRIAELEAELAAARAANAAKVEVPAASVQGKVTLPDHTAHAGLAGHADSLISISQQQHSWQSASSWLQESIHTAEQFSEKATAEAFSLRAEKVMAQEKKDEAEVAEFEALAASLRANASSLAQTVKQQTREAAREAIERETKSALAKVQWLEEEAQRAEADAADRRAKAAETMKQATEAGAQLTENVRRLRLRRTTAAN